MPDEALKKRINDEIANATVKVLMANEFRGSGVFITSDGYVLTAYHCIGEYPLAIAIEARFGERFNAELDEAKSLKHPDYDIAVLKINEKATHYLPLGTISSQNVTDEVVTTGYPAADIKDNQELGTYFGNISRFRGHKFENDAMRGRGHSGGPVYHYKTHRVIGLVTEGYKSEVMLNTGLATRFDALFKKWPELEIINNEAAQAWDKRLKKLGYGGSDPSIILGITILALLAFALYSFIPKPPIFSEPPIGEIERIPDKAVTTSPDKKIFASNVSSTLQSKKEELYKFGLSNTLQIKAILKNEEPKYHSATVWEKTTEHLIIITAYHVLKRAKTFKILAPHLDSYDPERSENWEIFSDILDVYAEPAYDLVFIRLNLTDEIKNNYPWLENVKSVKSCSPPSSLKTAQIFGFHGKIKNKEVILQELKVSETHSCISNMVDNLLFFSKIENGMGMGGGPIINTENCFLGMYIGQKKQNKTIALSYKKIGEIYNPKNFKEENQFTEKAEENQFTETEKVCWLNDEEN
jgi:hypothetical protein